MWLLTAVTCAAGPKADVDRDHVRGLLFRVDGEVQAVRVRSTDRKACAEAASHYADEVALATANQPELRDNRYQLMRSTALLEEAVRTKDERALPTLADEVQVQLRKFDDRLPPTPLAR